MMPLGRVMISSAHEFQRLRASDDPAEYNRAAHEEAPLTVWMDVIAQFQELRFWVAQNKTVPVEILEILCDDPDARVRFMVAQKRKLPEYLQFRLAKDPDSSVRERIACNAKATSRVLEALLQDDESRVRERAQTRLESTKPAI